MSTGHDEKQTFGEMQFDRVSYRENPAYSENDLKLGLFCQNSAYGGTISHAPREFEPSIKHNVEISKRADDLGFEMLVPNGTWKGRGGTTDFNGQSMECLTWAAAMAMETDYAGVFATVHTPLLHPLFAAKQSMTIDHASDGRFALNVVSGWNDWEIEMFGIKQLEHDRRYDRTAEWTEVYRRYCTEQGFEHEGEFYTVSGHDEAAERMRGNFTKGGYMRPKPLQEPHPPIMSAGASDAGRNFTSRYADLSFVPLFDLDEAAKHVENMKDRAEEHGRNREDIQVMTNGFCVMADTKKEAQERYEEIIEQGDIDGTHNLMDEIGIGSETFDSDQISAMEERFMTNYGGYPIVGTPEQVADELVEISKTGISGMLFVFYDYYHDLQMFGEEVLPLLEAAEVRTHRRGEPV